jgi:hypothetical protein
MAVGDVVSQIETLLLTNLYFQPAAGVEVAVMSVPGDGTTSAYVGLSDGVNNSYARSTDSVEFSQGLNTRIFINNTNYLFYRMNLSAPSFTGIQIK